MKDFIVQAPPKGTTTCSLLQPYYRPGDGRGKYRYLGSVNLARNPWTLPAGINLAKGFELTEEQLEEVRTFLIQHGTYGQLPVLPAEDMERIRGSVRRELEAEMRSRQPPALDGGVFALDVATAFVTQESHRLREAGVRLSPGMLNSLATEAKGAPSELDLVKVRANRIREAYQRFESALKSSGLMKSVKRAAAAKRAR